MIIKSAAKDIAFRILPFIVTDANGQHHGYVYFEDESQRQRGIGKKRQQAGQRALIPPSRAGEKRKANADDGATAFVGGVGGANAPRKNAARGRAASRK
jgi:hypothetical protein